jgi:hypothetical protein
MSSSSSSSAGTAVDADLINSLFRSHSDERMEEIPRIGQKTLHSLESEMASRPFLADLRVRVVLPRSEARQYRVVFPVVLTVAEIPRHPFAGRPLFKRAENLNHIRLYRESLSRTTYRDDDERQGYEFYGAHPIEIKSTVLLFFPEPVGVEDVLKNDVAEHRIGDLNVIRILAPIIIK